MADLLHPNQTEKTFAAIAHACVLIPFWGIIGAVGIWFTQKRQSRFIAFQSQQAIAYQLVSVFVGLCVGVYTSLLTFYLLFAPATEQSGSDFSSLSILEPNFCVGLFLLMYVGYGLWGAVSVLRGRDFRYLIIGTKVRRRFEDSGSLG